MPLPTDSGVTDSPSNPDHAARINDSATPPLPSPPTLVSPINGAARVKSPTLLSWLPAANATAYDVYVGTSPFDVAHATSSSREYAGRFSAPGLTLSSLAYRTTYTWRVEAIGPGGMKSSEPATFTVQPPPLGGPVISAELQVTDSSAGHTVGNSPNPECSNFVRIGDSLYFLYRCATPVGLYVRRFDLVTQEFSPAVLVDSPTDSPFNGYHSEPTLLRDQSGGLHVLNQYSTMIALCRGSFGTAPRYRVIPDFSKIETWSTPACLPSRFQTLYSTQFYDAMGLYDDRAGVTHCVGQSYGFAWLDGRPNDGFPRTYYRISPQGTPDGPYVIVESATGSISEIPAATSASIFTKGDLALGREALGQRSLHLTWSLRAEWNDASGPHQCNTNIYYARSPDGGNTWTNAAGTANVPLTQHIWCNDPRFLAYAGDVDQDSERSFDLDSNSRPFIAIKRHRPDTGVMIGTNVDVRATPPPAYDLIWVRWSGSSWVEGTIDLTTNWANQRPKVRLDLDDDVYVFVGDLPAYLRSRDGGTTWTGPITFGTKYSNVRFYSAPDPLDPNFHLLAYTDRHTLGMYFVRIQLTQP